MGNDPERQGERDDQVDEEMASADRTNGERPAEDEHGPPQRSDGSDRDAADGDVNDEDASRVARTERACIARGSWWANLASTNGRRTDATRGGAVVFRRSWPTSRRRTR